jgi:hypothetical protein
LVAVSVTRSRAPGLIQRVERLALASMRICE